MGGHRLVTQHDLARNEVRPLAVSCWRTRTVEAGAGHGGMIRIQVLVIDTGRHRALRPAVA